MHRAALAILAVLTLTGAARALETDQFTVPSRPLADAAPLLKAKVDAAIDAAVADANRTFDAEVRAAADAGLTFFHDVHVDKAAAQLAEDAIPDRLRAAFAVGLPECTIEKYVHQSADVFEISPGAGVFGRWLLDRPVTLMELSPTVNCYGVYFGTDKIGHFFQQGHEYYDIVLREQRAGRSLSDAVRSAVAHGIGQEKGIFGEAMVGSYSNADLAADYAGLKFYLNLTRPITVNGAPRPPILVRTASKWQRNPQVTDDYLRPFFSEHFNEAHNPCRYVSNLRTVVRENVAARAQSWLTFYHTTLPAEQQLNHRLATWYGEDYGHCEFDRLVTVPTALLDAATARASR